MYGPCSPVKMRSNTAKHTALTFHSDADTATAATVTSGISATKVWSWKILPYEPNYDHLLVLGVTPEKAPDEGGICDHDI